MFIQPVFGKAQPEYQQGVELGYVSSEMGDTVAGKSPRLYCTLQSVMIDLGHQLESGSN